MDQQHDALRVRHQRRAGDSFIQPRLILQEERVRSLRHHVLKYILKDRSSGPKVGSYKGKPSESRSTKHHPHDSYRRRETNEQLPRLRSKEYDYGVILTVDEPTETNDIGRHHHRIHELFRESAAPAASWHVSTSTKRLRNEQTSGVAILGTSGRGQGSHEDHSPYYLLGKYIYVCVFAYRTITTTATSR